MRLRMSPAEAVKEYVGLVRTAKARLDLDLETARLRYEAAAGLASLEFQRYLSATQADPSEIRAELMKQGGL